MLAVVMFLLALLVQPVCLLYTRTIMGNAAAESARVMLTTPDVQVATSFALRRLEAVPPVSVFHVGGREDWDVTMRKSSDGKSVQVSVRGHVRPLPFFGELVSWVFERDEEGVVLHVEVAEQLRPEWLDGTYDAWMDQW